MRFVDMPTRLPLDRLTVPVRKLSARPGEKALARHQAALLLLPVSPATIDWSALPHAQPLRALIEAKPRKGGDLVTLRVGERAQTLLVAAIVDATMGAFELLQFVGKAAQAALQERPRTVLVWELGLEAARAGEALCAAMAALQAGAFELPQFKSRPAPPRLMRIELAAKTRPKDLERTLAGAAGNNIARWLTSLPPNRLDAAGYRRCLEDFARLSGMHLSFYGERRLRRLGAGAFLAGARGHAARDAGIARVSYRPPGARRAGAPDLCLVGKGICFDTGGTNLKAHSGMLEMHTDMQGSAVALGCLHALSTLRSPLAVDGWLAITENRIGPTAYQPQDIVRAHNGTTIQVIHTDAEGRMVLADTLSLAAATRPRAIIDYATLTGACVRALTERYSGAFTNRLRTREIIEAAGASSGERVWCFPMDADFDTDLDSKVADIMQCAVDGKGDNILAARFLSRFVPPQVPWLHLDLAAGMRRGGLGHIGTDITGFGVRFTLELLARDWPAAARRA